MKKNLRFTGLIMLYNIVILPIVTWGFAAFNFMGTETVTARHPQVYKFYIPFHILFDLGYRGGIFLAIIIISIGYLNIFKKWGIALIRLGLLIPVLFLISLSARMLVVIFSFDNPYLIRGWIIGETLLILIPALFTGLVFQKIRKIERSLRSLDEKI